MPEISGKKKKKTTAQKQKLKLKQKEKKKRVTMALSASVGQRPQEGQWEKLLTAKARQAVSHLTKEASSMMTPAGQAAFLQSTLPYDAPLVRVRPHGAAVMLSSTALARNFVTLDLPLAQLLNISINSWPTFESNTGGLTTTGVWGDPYVTGIPAVSVHDPYLLGIVPYPCPLACAYHSVGNVSPQAINATLSRTSKSSTALTAGLGSLGGSLGVCIAPSHFEPTSGFPGYGPVHPCFSTGEPDFRLRYFWLDASPANVADMAVTITPIAPASTGGSNVRVRVLRVTHNGPVEVSDLPMPAALGGSPSTVSISIDQSGYYSVLLLGSLIASTGGVHETYTTTIDFLLRVGVVSRHIINPHIADASILVDRVQPNGSACLVRNTQAAIAKGQMCFALSVSDDEFYFPQYTGFGDKKVISSNSTTRYEGPWEHGIYGFVKPFKAFAPYDAYETVAGQRPYVGDAFSYPGFNVFLIQATASTDYPPKSTMTFCTAYEFTTESQMFVKGHSLLKQDDFGKLIDLLQTQHPFTENPLHWSAFLDALKGGARKVMDWAPKIAKGVATGADVASKIASVLAAL